MWRRWGPLLIVAVGLFGCSNGNAETDDRIAALEQQLEDLEQELAVGSSAPSLLPSTTSTTSASTTTEPPTITTTTEPPTTTTTVTPVILLGEYPTHRGAIGVFDLGSGLSEGQRVMGRPPDATEPTEIFSGERHSWFLLDGWAWVALRDNPDPNFLAGGALDASCDPAGPARLPLFGGLLLCESTVADLIATWGLPDSSAKDGFYAVCFEGEEYGISFSVDEYRDAPYGGLFDTDVAQMDSEAVLTGIGIFFWDQFVSC